jgi:hypothetical protein
MSREVATDVAWLLEASGLNLTRPPTGTSLFVGPMPDVDEGAAPRAVSVLLTGGPPPTGFIGRARAALWTATCQVRVRSDREDFSGGQMLALSVLEALHQPKHASYLSVRVREGAPLYLGTDGADRHLWSMNVQLEYRT